MGRKGKWFDTVQRILITSEPDPVETQNDDAAKDWKLDHHEKAAKLRDNKSAIRRIWQFGKSNSSGASASATAPEDAEVLQFPKSPRSDNEYHVVQDLTEEVPFMETRGEEEEEEDGERMNPGDEVAASPDSKADAAPMTAWSARSKEDIAATRIQAACRGHLARRGQQERGMARLMSLVDEGFAVRRQTQEALYCMQMMTRIQTQLYTRRLKTEKDKKVLKSQTKAVNKHSLDKAKIGEGWDHSLQSKEQMETVQKMKQEAATRRQRALSYAFSQQWRNRNTSSARAAHGPAPMYMEPGNPNWGWCWAERWMAATRPWENQTMPPPDTGRAASKSASTRLPRVAVSVQIPTATTTPKGKPFRPPNWSSSSSLSSPSTPPPRRTATLASPRSGPLHATSGLQHSKSLQPDHRRPRSSQELSGAGAQHATTTATMRLERRPRSSQDRGMSSPRLLGAKDAPLRRTASLRSELPIRLSLGSAVAAAAVGDDEGAPVTPSYIHPAKKSVRAKVRCPSPSAAAATPDMFDALESSPAPPLQVPPSPSSAKKRLSQAFADKPSASSPSKVALERVRRHSQLISSPRMSLS
ncbi:IQ-domain 3 [Zea mays]|uniref:IQ-domain 3 n=1 Tax=Zea mays TaxID=4577 RepID=A0A1D6M634_MAIZE|nr:IQ-domain 3 [Zea mays]